MSENVIVDILPNGVEFKYQLFHDGEVRYISRVTASNIFLHGRVVHVGVYGRFVRIRVELSDMEWLNKNVK